MWNAIKYFLVMNPGYTYYYYYYYYYHHHLRMQNTVVSHVLLSRSRKAWLMLLDFCVLLYQVNLDWW